MHQDIACGFIHFQAVPRAARCPVSAQHSKSNPSPGPPLHQVACGPSMHGNHAPPRAASLSHRLVRHANLGPIIPRVVPASWPRPSWLPRPHDSTDACRRITVVLQGDGPFSVGVSLASLVPSLSAGPTDFPRQAGEHAFDTPPARRPHAARECCHVDLQNLQKKRPIGCNLQPHAAGARVLGVVVDKTLHLRVM